MCLFVKRRDESEGGGVTVEDKHRTVTDDAKVSGLEMPSQVVFSVPSAQTVFSFAL